MASVAGDEKEAHLCMAAVPLVASGWTVAMPSRSWLCLGAQLP